MQKVIVLGLALAAIACVPTYDHAATPRVGATVREVARFDEQPTGVAVSRDGRIFVSFPNWWTQPRDALVEVRRDGSVRPYPDEHHSRWNGEEGEAARSSFVCPQKKLPPSNRRISRTRSGDTRDWGIE